MINEKLAAALARLRDLHECDAEVGTCETCKAHHAALDAASGEDPPYRVGQVTTPGAVMATAAFMRIAPKFYNDPSRGNERITILAGLARDIDRAFYAYLKREKPLVAEQCAKDVEDMICRNAAEDCTARHSEAVNRALQEAADRLREWYCGEGEERYMAKKQYSFHIDIALHQRVRLDAAYRGVRNSDIVEEALREYYERRDKKGKPSGKAQD